MPIRRSIKRASDQRLGCRGNSRATLVQVSLYYTHSDSPYSHILAHTIYLYFKPTVNVVLPIHNGCSFLFCRIQLGPSLAHPGSAPKKGVHVSKYLLFHMLDLPQGFRSMMDYKSRTKDQRVTRFV